MLCVIVLTFTNVYYTFDILIYNCDTNAVDTLETVLFEQYQTTLKENVISHI